MTRLPEMVLFKKTFKRKFVRGFRINEQPLSARYYHVMIEVYPLTCELEMGIKISIQSRTTDQTISYGLAMQNFQCLDLDYT